MDTSAKTLTEVPMRVRLSKEANQKLLACAAQSGRNVDDYASELLERAMTRPTLEEILAPVHADIEAGGMSDEQIMDLGRCELEALRQERKSKAS
jgi:hypothetical protein